MSFRNTLSRIITIFVFVLTVSVFFQNSATILLAQKSDKKKTTEKKADKSKKKPTVHIKEKPQEEAPDEEVEKISPKGISKEYKDENEDEGRESMSGTVEWQVVLFDDNENKSLPPRFRTWWYVRLDGIHTKEITTFHIIGDGWKAKEYVLPVYSYDRKNWHRFKPEDIVDVKGAEGVYDYTIQKQFDSSSVVWVARYYPYSFSRLQKFLRRYEKNPYLKIDTIGTTTEGKPMLMVTITDPKTPDKNKKRIWIHARTHPSETGSSFVVEGLIEYLLSDCNIHCKKADLSNLIFNIVPMVNIDGVVQGNSRVTPESSIDLERQWYRKADNTLDVPDTVAKEVKILNSTIVKLYEEGPEFIAALNIHSKNAEPDWRSFIYTNFTKPLEAHGAEGNNMFIKHLQFAKSISDEFCGDTIDVRTSYDPGIPMERKPFPESWWWVNFKDSVMAMTIETTSGRNGCFEDWVNYRDQMKLGEAIAIALGQYYMYYLEKKWDKYNAPITDMDRLLKYFKGYSNER